MINETKWSIDQANSQITFKVGHIIISNIKGSFKTFGATVFTDGTNFNTAEIDLWIDANSISTGDKNRDIQLKGKDFLDAEKHPQITFNITHMKKQDKDGNHELWGELTIKGISKRVTLYTKSWEILDGQKRNEKAKFIITGKFNRSDWDLYGKSSFEVGGMMVSKDVKILCNIQLINMGIRDQSIELQTESSKNNF